MEKNNLSELFGMGVFVKKHLRKTMFTLIGELLFVIGCIMLYFNFEEYQFLVNHNVFLYIGVSSALIIIVLFLGFQSWIWLVGLFQLLISSNYVWDYIDIIATIKIHEETTVSSNIAMLGSICVLVSGVFWLRYIKREKKNK